MIGILGGTFDPIHVGHLHIARQALRRLKLEALQFLPCARPVHRALPQASPEQRCAMIELALAGERDLSLNRIEVDRGGPSYTIDTLRELHPACDSGLVLLLGADAFNAFDTWKAPAEILELANLAVCIRPGIEVAPDLYPELRVASAEALSKRSAGAILLLAVDAPDCSSSSVRAALDAGEIPRRWLHPDVARYIRQNQLYRRPGD